MKSSCHYTDSLSDVSSASDQIRLIRTNSRTFHKKSHVNTPSKNLQILFNCARVKLSLIFHVLILLFLPTFSSCKFDDLWFLTTSLGHYSLFPLFFTPVENILKLALFAVYQACFYRNSKNGKSIIHKIILFGQALLMIYTEIPVIHSRIFGDGNMEFLPIMIISVYTGIGLIYCYLEFAFGIFVGNYDKSGLKSENKIKKSK